MLMKVKTKYGYVQGVPAETEGVAAFKGIPYATPPVGELRWRAPRPVKPWEGTLNCDAYQAAAMQTKATIPFYVDEFPIDYSRIRISEDCLYLNVWTPAEAAGDKLPVMVYIHGGGNVTGFPHEPEHDGAFIAKKHVIYVNITYRLNIFGFMAHPQLTEESGCNASGNYGLLDQLAALKWVRENIENFGGDPENVTVFGQSAGAGNVHVHCTSALSRGLFKRAISMSGSGVVSLMRASSLETEEKKGLAFQEAAACKSLKELRELPEAMVLAYMLKSGINCSFCVDNYLLKEDPSQAIIEGRHHEIDYMVGSCANEGAAFGYGYRDTVEGVKSSVYNFFPGIAEKAWELCNIHSDRDAADCGLDVMADGAVYGTNYWAKLHNLYGRKPVYVYYFCHRIPDVDGNPSKEGAFHSGDLWYAHGTLKRSRRAFGEADVSLSDLLISYFTNFSKNGDPNGEGLPEWTPYTGEQPCSMLLCSNPYMDTMEDNLGVLAVNSRD